MKTVLINTRIVAIALVAVLGLSSPVLANPVNGPAGVEFRFIGNHKNQPVFELSFNNVDETEYLVEVVDEYNVVLYRETVKAGSNTKKFMLNTEELGNVGLRFEITGKKSNKTVVYEVNRNSRLVEDLVVNKLK